MRLRLTGLFALVLFASVAFGDVYSTSFEAPTYSQGELVGQDGWFGTTTYSTVSSDYASEGNWSLRQGGTSNPAQYSLTAYDFGDNVRVSMSFMPSAFTGTSSSAYAPSASVQMLLQDDQGGSAASTAVMFYYWGSIGSKKILTKKYEGGTTINSYVNLAANDWNDDGWNTLDITMDFASHTYDVALNGVVHDGAAGIALDPNATKLGTLWLFRGAINGPARPYAYFDDLEVASVPEPVTLSLLAVGGLCCLYRRKNR